MKVLISGASGFIGSALAASLRAQGHAVCALTRNRDGPNTRQWQPSGGPLKPQLIEGFDAIVHLAGAPIQRRWTRHARQLIWDSRVPPTRLLANAIRALRHPPRVFISASAAGFYGHCPQPCDASHPAGAGFTAALCAAWEQAATPVKQAGVRLVHARIGLPLHPSGGLLRALLPIYRLGLGGPIGAGEQRLPWIGRSDLVRALIFCLNNSLLHGPVNLCAPKAVSQAQLSATLAAALHRPARLRTPAALVRLLFGQMGTELMLWGQNTRATRLSEAGFVWDQPSLKDSLSALTLT